MADTTRDKFFGAITESYEALLSAIEATEARGHKISHAVLEEARQGEKELVGLARKWADAPTNFFENVTAMVDAQARAQRRALELARDSLAGAGEYGNDVQDALRRVIKANLGATEATVEVARQAYSRLRGGDGTKPATGRAARATRVPVAAGDGADEKDTD